MISEIVGFLDSDNTEVRKNAAGAIANFAFESPELRERMNQEKVIPKLFNLLSSDAPLPLIMACRALNNLCSTESLCESVASSGGFESLNKILQNKAFDSTVHTEVISTISTLTENGMFQFIFLFILHSNVMKVSVFSLQ
jgi:hypothetical protein